MKTRQFNVKRLIPVLGIAVVAGSLMAATTYLKLGRTVRANEAATATYDRLAQDLELSAVLKNLQDGQVDLAAQRLDQLLCGHIFTTDAELASADPQTRAFAGEAFRGIAQLRPKTNNEALTSAAPQGKFNQAAAEKILTVAQATGHDKVVK